MTHYIYTTNLSFEMVIEAKDRADANRAINRWLDKHCLIENPDGVLNWDIVSWDEPQVAGDEEDEL